MRYHVRIIATAVVLASSGCSSAVTTSPPATGTRAVDPADGMGMSMSTPAAVPTTAAASTLLDPSAFAAAVDRPGTVTIDVHIPFAGKIAGTDKMIPYDEIAQRAAELPADHGVELAIYCQTGSMSAVAATTLASLGYHHVVELEGGMWAWESAGRTLLTTP